MRLPRPGRSRRVAVLTAVFVVWFVPPPPATGEASRTAPALTQPVNLQAFHRDGQTFITWREVDELFQEDRRTAFREIPGRVGHLGGIIRNNVIWSGIGRLFDSGIGLEQAHGVKVYHNTVYAGDGFSSIDARFPNSNPLIKNNLVSLRMTVRDGGRPSMEGNVDSASADMFVDAATGDLRLRATATQAIDRGVDVRGDVPDEVSGHARDATPDLGAHEYVAGTGRALSSASSPRRP
jgi:hypothetical protein